MSVPKRLLVEYDDSSTKEVAFNKVDRQTQLELARLGLCPPPSEVGSSKYYLLMRWKDGVREVIGVDGDAVELLRYYIIRRIEDRGRLSVDVGADYPELFIIRRMPMELSSLLIIGSDGVKKYNLESEVERWEGIFEAGGKKEYMRYDKTDSQYPQEFSEDPDSLSEITGSLKKVLDEKGLNPRKLLETDQSQKMANYKEIAQATGIRSYQRQEDVYGFIDSVVARLAEK